MGSLHREQNRGRESFWKGFKEQKPAFATDSILPNINYGTILANGEVVTTAKWVKSL